MPERPGALVQAAEDLPIAPEVRDAWLRHNALPLLGERGEAAA